MGVCGSLYPRFCCNYTSVFINGNTDYNNTFLITFLGYRSLILKASSIQSKAASFPTKSCSAIVTTGIRISFNLAFISRVLIVSLTLLSFPRLIGAFNKFESTCLVDFETVGLGGSTFLTSSCTSLGEFSFLLLWVLEWCLSSFLQQEQKALFGLLLLGFLLQLLLVLLWELRSWVVLFVVPLVWAEVLAEYFLVLGLMSQIYFHSIGNGWIEIRKAYPRKKSKSNSVIILVSSADFFLCGVFRKPMIKCYCASTAKTILIEF